MNKQERKMIQQIRKDCIKLRKHHELTEFGFGQLLLCEMLLQKKKVRK